MKTQFKNKSVAFHEMELKFEKKFASRYEPPTCIKFIFSVVEKMY